QAKDGIRDFHVTGVQTCALPIWRKPQKRSQDILGYPIHEIGVPFAEIEKNTCLRICKKVLHPIYSGAIGNFVHLPEVPLHDRNEIGRASCREREQTTVVGGAW